MCIALAYIWYNRSVGRLPLVTHYSVATAALDNHIFVFLQIHIRVVQVVEHRDGRQPGRCTAGLWHFAGIQQMHQRLHNGMIGGVHVRIQREIAFAGTIERIVAVWRHNPILPFQFLETDMHCVDLATAMVFGRRRVQQRIFEFGLAFVSFPLHIAVAVAALCACVGAGFVRP